MPYVSEWVSNEVAFEIEGIEVYHVYRDDEWDQGVRNDKYTLDENGNEEDDAFRIADLPLPEGYSGPKLPTQFLSKPEHWRGTYDDWKQSDTYTQLSSEWDQWHKTGSRQNQIARLTNAIANKLGPWAEDAA